MILTKVEAAPWALLACSIIGQAKKDIHYRASARDRGGPYEEQSAVRASARRFLLSEECRGLCEMLDRDYGVIVAYADERPRATE